MTTTPTEAEEIDPFADPETPPTIPAPAALPAPVPDAEATDADAPTEVHAFGDDEGITGVFDTRTGEIIDIPEAPRLLDGQAMTTQQVEWYADRVDRAEATIAGLEAARAAELEHWQGVITAKYDARIKRERGKIEWLNRQYWYALRRFAEAAITGARAKFVRVGSRRLQFRLSSGGIDIVDKAAALTWAKKNYPAAVKVEESVLVSVVGKQLSADAKLPETSGLKRRDPENKFSVEKG